MLPILFLLLTVWCSHQQNASLTASASITEATGINPYARIADIPLPSGFARVDADTASYASWLRNLPLKKDKTVFLFDGSLKTNQQAQYAVLAVSTGSKDLQQCADAVMRLRAEYLYAHKRFSAIDFIDNNHIHYRLPQGADRPAFDRYLEKVFSRCGTASLSNQLVSVSKANDIVPTGIFIKGGSPGHALQVMDVAINAQGKKIFLLAQSYMPAQDIHVVVNPADNRLSPWYEVNNSPVLETPQWIFARSCLKKWPDE